MATPNMAKVAVSILGTLLVMGAILLVARTARAEDGRARFCNGPEKCCPSEILDETPPRRKPVDVGVVMIGISEINEKSSTWTADFYLYEEWSAVRGFVPQTEIYNEVTRVSEQFDRTVVVDGERCQRSRRIRSVLHTNLNLRTFPFDYQNLELVLSDAEFDSKQLGYKLMPTKIGMDDVVVEQLSAWKFERKQLKASLERRPFKWDEGGAAYDYATFSVKVRRHVSFHLSKYFLPLLLIVIVSFSVFWIDPEDLSSEVQIGVTCVLAAIALEFTEGSALPDVSYLTISDRTFSICYVAIGLAVVQTVYTNRLTRSGRKEQALRVDRRSRVLFPLCLAVALVLAWIRAYTQAT